MLTAESSIGEREKWCAREDLNLQALRHQILSLACLPFHHARLPDTEPVCRKHAGLAGNRKV